MLTGKDALVTGASKGIGACTAPELARNGAAVIVNYHGNTLAAEKVVADIKAIGGVAIAVKADVSQEGGHAPLR